VTKPPPGPPACRKVWLHLVPGGDAAASQHERLKRLLRRMGRLRPVTPSILELSYEPRRTTGKEIRARLRPYAPLLQRLHWRPATGLAPESETGQPHGRDAASGEPLPSWRAYLQSAYAVCSRFAPASRRAPHQWRRHLQDND